MSDSRRRKPRDPPYWLTGPKGGKSANGKQLPFVSLYADLLQSKEFQELAPGEQMLYIMMTLEAKRQETFEFSRATAEQYGISNAALRRCVPKLIDAGFISVVENNRTRRKPNIYRFELGWIISKKPASHG